MTSGAKLFLVLTDDCAHGGKCTVTPSGAAEIIDHAMADDGKPVAIVIRPVQRSFDVACAIDDVPLGAEVRLKTAPPTT